MDWCEQNDINPEEEFANDMAWTSEFEAWLDKLSSSSPLSEKQMTQLELDFNKGVRHGR